MKWNLVGFLKNTYLLKQKDEVKILKYKGRMNSRAVVATCKLKGEGWSLGLLLLIVYFEQLMFVKEEFYDFFSDPNTKKMKLLTPFRFKYQNDLL